MEFRNVLLIIVIVALLYMLYKYIIKDTGKVTGLTSAKTMQTIDPSDLGTSSNGGNSSNFAYSIWFYIDDWNYRYGEPKIIFGRKSGNIGSSGTSDSNQLLPCPVVTLTPILNNIEVSLAVFSGDQTNELTNNTPNTNVTIHRCNVANVPIQRWVNLIVSVYGRSLDIYIDGKLVRTCVLPGVAKVDSNAPVYITPENGFAGWTARFQYMKDSINPQDAWNIYEKGYGASILGNTFGTYSVKLSLMKENDVESSITI